MENRRGGSPEIIDTYGWQVIGVAPRPDSGDAQERFSCSTGRFMRFQHPELPMCGLNADVSRGIINSIGNELKSGRKSDLHTDCIDLFAAGVKCRFRPIHASRYAEYAGWAIRFYEEKLSPLWQCFWADDAGKYPWEEACDPSVAGHQPLLDKPSEKVM